jgi:hypothetical protein
MKISISSLRRIIQEEVLNSRFFSSKRLTEASEGYGSDPLVANLLSVQDDEQAQRELLDSERKKLQAERGPHKLVNNITVTMGYQKEILGKIFELIAELMGMEIVDLARQELPNQQELLDNGLDALQPLIDALRKVKDPQMQEFAEDFTRRMLDYVQALGVIQDMDDLGRTMDRAEDYSKFQRSVDADRKREDVLKKAQNMLAGNPNFMKIYRQFKTNPKLSKSVTDAASAALTVGGWMGGKFSERDVLAARTYFTQNYTTTPPPLPPRRTA